MENYNLVFGHFVELIGNDTKYNNTRYILMRQNCFVFFIEQKRNIHSPDIQQRTRLNMLFDKRIKLFLEFHLRNVLDFQVKSKEFNF